MLTKELPKISIIILNFNGRNFLSACLESVFESDYSSFEVILVDNCSTDDSVEFVQKKYIGRKNFTLIANQKNLGFAGGNNQGAKRAKGQWLMFLNNDTEVEKNWLKNLIKEVLRNDNIAAAGCKQRSLIKKTHLDAVGGWLDRFGWSQKTGYKERDHGQYDRVEEVFYGQGSSLLVRADIFRKLGGFDESYIIYYEEVDLCWRLHLAGFKVIFVPKAIVYHYGGGWQKAQPSSAFFYLLRRNHLTTLLKNYSLGRLAWILPTAMFFYFLSILIFLLTGRPARAWAYFRAIGYNFLHLPEILKKRTLIQKKFRKVPDRALGNLFIPGVLFFHQFIKRN